MTMLRPHPLGIPLPTPSRISRPFWDGCRQGTLLFQRCDSGHIVFNPASRCRICLSDALTWEASGGTGHVYTWSVIWRPQTPAFRTPYAASIIELDEGYQMIANVVGCDHLSVSIGMRVRVEFHPIGESMMLPYFAPIPPGEAGTSRD
jgi:uncharacterized protein